MKCNRCKKKNVEFPKQGRICKACIQKEKKQYYLDNADRFKKKARKRYIENREDLIIKQRIYALNHKAEAKGRSERWIKNPKNRVKAILRAKKHYEDTKKNRRWVLHFRGARMRCNNPKHDRYKNYGNRGIKFLMTENDFKILWFRDKAYLMVKPSIDRIDSDGHYKMSNCRFIEHKKNTRRYGHSDRIV